MVKSFTASLAEVCPALWSPEYLSVFQPHTCVCLYVHPAEHVIDSFAQVPSHTNYQPFAEKHEEWRNSIFVLARQDSSTYEPSHE